MNVKLQFDIEFLGGTYFHDALHLNSYSVTINMLTQTTNADSTNVAMERLRCFITNDLENTVFFGPNNQEEAELFRMLGTNVTTLPEEPVDQIIGLMLYCKLNAIMQGRMVISNLGITSTAGGVWFNLDEDDALGPFAQPGWWQEPTVQHNNLPEPESESAENVVRVKPSPWIEYGLLWPEERQEHQNNTVAYPEFGKK